MVKALTDHRKKVVTRQQLDYSREYVQIRNKIDSLKKEFRKYSHGRMGELYRILTEIVELKRALPENRGFGKTYKMRSLEWEEDLGITAMEIRYISSYIFISDYGKECVEKGLIHDSTICHFLAVHALLRQEKWQNILIDKVIKEKIKVSQVSELTKAELILFLEGKLEKRMSDDYFFTATKTIRSVNKRILERKHLLKGSNFSKHLLSSVEKLYLELKYNIEASQTS